MGLQSHNSDFFPPQKLQEKKSELLDKILQLSFLFFYLAEMGVPYTEWIKHRMITEYKHKVIPK